MRFAENVLGAGRPFPEVREGLVAGQFPGVQVNDGLVDRSRGSRLQQVRQPLVAGLGGGAEGAFGPAQLSHLGDQVLRQALGQGGGTLRAMHEAVDDVLRRGSFQQVAAGAAAQHADDRRPVAGGRIGEHPGVGRDLPDPHGGSQAAPTGHQDVEQGEVGLAAAAASATAASASPTAATQTSKGVSSSSSTRARRVAGGVVGDEDRVRPGRGLGPGDYRRAGGAAAVPAVRVPARRAAWRPFTKFTAGLFVPGSA